SAFFPCRREPKTRTPAATAPAPASASAAPRPFAGPASMDWSPPCPAGRQPAADPRPVFHTAADPLASADDPHLALCSCHPAARHPRGVSAQSSYPILSSDGRWPGFSEDLMLSPALGLPTLALCSFAPLLL